MFHQLRVVYVPLRWCQMLPTAVRWGIGSTVRLRGSEQRLISSDTGTHCLLTQVKLKISVMVDFSATIILVSLKGNVLFLLLFYININANANINISLISSKKSWQKNMVIGELTDMRSARDDWHIQEFKKKISFTSNVSNILHTNFCPLYVTIRPTPWILKQGGMNSSGQRLISLNWKTKRMVHFISSFLAGNKN